MLAAVPRYFRPKIKGCRVGIGGLEYLKGSDRPEVLEVSALFAPSDSRELFFRFIKALESALIFHKLRHDRIQSY